jgi:hypothetical protein
MGLVGRIGTEVLAGIGIVVAAPIVTPVLGKVVRPAAKGLIKSYLTAAECTRSKLADAKKEWTKLVDEAKAEQAASREAVPGAAAVNPV